jgi:valyl-tRNA synthetase
MADDVSRALRPSVPDRPTVDGIEQAWVERWERDGIFHFDRTATRERIFSIDTPPPTVSGALHMGSVFGYTQTDCVARYRRMRGLKVFYPMGWDDNGLATERRVETFYGVRCDPSIPFDPDFVPPERTKDRIAISRPNFVALCHQLTSTDEVAFKALWQRLGLSVDWSLEYATISPLAQRQSQRAFLRMLPRGEVYAREAPTVWDVDFQTAVSQAEIEDRDHPGAAHRVAFRRADGEGSVIIETTRPELLPSCVALVANPSDERYAPLFGTEVVTPLFGVRVPVLAHELAAPDKGTGIAMVCTFGDLTDVQWWRELSLPLRALLGRNGRFQPVTFGTEGFESDDPDAANDAYAKLAGATVRAAQTTIVELLTAAGALVGPPTPIRHPVKFYERGERPLEVVTSRQWFIRTLPLREKLLELGTQIDWHPPFMAQRYRSWVEGLNVDWCVSRQRYFGVPFPVWYEVGDDGVVLYDRLLLPSEERLPVDPSTDVPDAYLAEQRGRPGGFAGDPDVMDTWATSSLTPQIVGRWVDDPELFARVFPMDLRPQGPEIIRTWLFSTVVRSELEHHELPWRHTMINGWILDPDRKKLSKSSGHASTPMKLLEDLGSDAVRYWAASGRPGTDTAESTDQMKVGRRLGVKVLNATKFVLGRLEGTEGLGLDAVSDPLDVDLLAVLAEIVAAATAAFETFDYARALERTEAFFWRYCDDYLELVKVRAYGEQDEPATRSARGALLVSLSVLLRLLAPFLAFSTEEAWSWFNDASIHSSAWPTADELGAPQPPKGVFDAVGTVLGAVRREKAAAKRSMRSGVAAVTVTGPRQFLEAIEAAKGDLSDAGVIRSIELSEGGEQITVVLAEPEAPSPGSSA